MHNTNLGASPLAEDSLNVAPFYISSASSVYPVNKPVKVETINWDSVFTAFVPIENPHRESLLKGHTLQPANQTLIPREQPPSQPDWFLMVVMIIVAIIGLFKSSYRVHLPQVITSIVDNRNLQYLLRDTNLSRSLSRMPMVFIYSTALSLAIFVAQRHTGIINFALNDELLYLALFAGCTLFLMLRQGLIFLLGNTFECTQTAITYNITSNLFNYLAGLTLVPTMLIVGYCGLPSSVNLHILAITIGLMFILRLASGFKNVLTATNSSKYYLFYYLCMVEIMPLIVLAKTVIS